MDQEMNQLSMLKRNLSNDEKMQFDSQYNSRRKNPTTALILSLFLGALGVDRFYIGKTGLGVGKLLTGGGIGVWAIIDWFLIMGATRQRNNEFANQVHMSIVQMRPA